ncbi:MAG TPA: polysaccharide deacetylase family protein [Candidatus Paceibacterota bacterium]|nr:polysaccharide deacetylase family protein [Candidatus Paceibacterota bacterium]
MDNPSQIDPRSPHQSDLTRAIKSLGRTFVYTVAKSVWRQKNVAVVLTYHSISNAPLFGTVRPTAFAQQMRYLAQKKFNVVSLAQLDEYRAQGSIPPKTVAITFDDGYRDNLENAIPLLKQYGFPATIFVTTSLIGRSFDRHGVAFPMLSEQELKELQQEGLINIEPHTVSHKRLTKIDLAEAKEEMRASKEVIERLLGLPRERFAYPYGSQNPAIRDCAAALGITSAYATREGFVYPNSKPHLLHRNGINATMSLAQFAGVARVGLISRRRLLGKVPQN